MTEEALDTKFLPSDQASGSGYSILISWVYEKEGKLYCMGKYADGYSGSRQDVLFTGVQAQAEPQGERCYIVDCTRGWTSGTSFGK